MISASCVADQLVCTNQAANHFRKSETLSRACALSFTPATPCTFLFEAVDMFFQLRQNDRQARNKVILHVFAATTRGCLPQKILRVFRQRTRDGHTWAAPLIASSLRSFVCFHTSEPFLEELPSSIPAPFKRFRKASNSCSIRYKKTKSKIFGRRQRQQT